MSATIIEFKPKVAEPIVRRRFTCTDLWAELLGMTRRQAGLADDLSFRDPERRARTVEALCRFVDAMEPFEKAVEGYREELLKNLDAHCPRAAKRIREGKPPRVRPAKAILKRRR
jgi:hypothetical protein